MLPLCFMFILVNLDPPKLTFSFVLKWRKSVFQLEEMISLLLLLHVAVAPCRFDAIRDIN